MYQHLLVESNFETRVDIVTLNRPERLNSLNPPRIQDLLNYFQTLHDLAFKTKKEGVVQEYEPRVIVLKGAGKSFCAGLDIVSDTNGLGASYGIAESYRTQRQISEIVVRMRRVKQPIISLVQGSCCGGGLALICASDIRLATTDMRFNVAMASIGLTGCDIGISYFLPRQLGPSVAAELCMTGRFMKADRAYSLGFLSSIHDNYRDMEKTSEDLVKDMLENLTELALPLTKDGLNISLQATSLEQQISLEDRQQVMCLNGNDFAERVIAFAAKSSSSKKKSKI